MILCQGEYPERVSVSCFYLVVIGGPKNLDVCHGLLDDQIVNKPFQF